MSGSAGGSGCGVTVTKVDASEITKKLSDAEFTLYEVDMDGALKSGLESATKKIRSDTTGDDGTVKFGSATQKMEAYKLYCLEETKAPDGYNVVSKPVWILLRGQDEQKYQEALAKAESLKAKYPEQLETPTVSTDIAVYDVPYTGEATISATKLLQGSTLQEGQFAFALKDANGKVLQTVKNLADGKINFVLDYTKMGTYTYFISEVVPEGAEGNVKDHITYDAAEHKVKVDVKKGDRKLEATVTYDGADPSTPPTFTNKYSTTLPEAGGAGLTMTYLAGASMLCFAATWMHARRHRDLDRGGRHE